MRVGSMHKKQPHSSHWHKVSAQFITTDVNVAILRFPSAQRREATLAKEQASTGEIGKQYQRVKEHRRVRDSSAYYAASQPTV